jgi:hypothetical protein
MEDKTGRPHAITSLVKIHTHLSIIIGGGLFTLFGYVLGGGSG